MRLRLTGLWRQPDFLKLWAGQTISTFGSQVTMLALPLAAVFQLAATPGQMGLLRAASGAPFLLFGLLAGVWVDRLRRRPLMIAADLGRVLLLGSIPIAGALGVLSIGQLYAVGFVAGTLAVFYTVAYSSFLPSVVGREHLVDANGKLFASSSVAMVAGPSVGGALIQLLTAPLAIALDALSFLVSALFLSLNRAEEQAPSSSGADRRSVWREICDGLRFIWSNRLLRSLTLTTAAVQLCSGVWSAVYVLFLTGPLHLDPGRVGLLFAVGGAGALAGATLSERCVKRFGFGDTVLGSVALFTLTGPLTPLVKIFNLPAMPLLLTNYFIVGLISSMYSVNVVSLSQAITPARMLGRMNASIRTVIYGAAPVGALVGGVLGGRIGLTATLWVAAAGMLLALPPLWFSPVRGMREPPAPADESSEPAAPSREAKSRPAA